jgi:hypothetical protein
VSGFERSMPRQRQPVTGRLVEAALPVEAPGAEREAMLLRQQSEIADPHDRVLQMGRDHREVLLVERNEPQKFHDAPRPS